MDFSWMGVGSEMSILEIALLVSSFKGNPGNTSVAATELAVGDSRSEEEGTSGLFIEEEGLTPRFWKQGRQYTGLPGLGRKGRVVDLLQLVHTASKRFPRLDVRAAFELVLVCK